MELTEKKCKCFSKKNWNFLLCTLFASSMLFVSFSFSQSIDIELLIKQADTVRQSDRKMFNSIVTQIEQNRHQLSSIQKLYLTYFKGYQGVISGELEYAFELLNQVINQDEAPFLKHRAITTKVTAYTTAENYHEGFILLNQMLPMLDDMKDKNTLHLALFVISQFYNRLEQYELSQVYVNQLLSDKPSDKFRCIASLLKFEARYRLKQLSENDINNSQVGLCQRVNEHIASGAIYKFTVDWYLDNGQLEKSLLLLKEHEQAVLDTQYYILISSWQSLFAQAYFQLGDFENAEKYALKVNSSLKPENKLESYTKATFFLYKINKSRQKFENALHFHEQYQRNSILLVEDAKKRNVSYQVAQKDNQEKAHEILLLEEKNKRLLVEQALSQQTNRSRNLLIFMLSVVIFGLIALAVRSYIAQNKLKNIADLDELTGIFNRRCFNELAESALTYCAKTKQPVSILLFDIDKFKSINDKFGHQVGDWALKQVVNTCTKLRRKNDIIGRYGGEEFTILLPGCPLSKAIALAELYREAIEKIPTADSGYDFNITASFGVFSSVELNLELGDIIKAADHAMYYSKANGRNRVSVYHESMPSTQTPTSTVPVT